MEDKPGQDRVLGENELYIGQRITNEYITEVLYRLGYKWPITDDRYLEHAIDALDKLGFFE